MKWLALLARAIAALFAPKCKGCRVRLSSGRIITDTRGRRWCEECWVEASFR